MTLEQLGFFGFSGSFGKRPHARCGRDVEEQSVVPQLGRLEFPVARGTGRRRVLLDPKHPKNPQPFPLS